MTPKQRKQHNDLLAENERLRECMRQAGLQAFMRDRDPGEVAEHLSSVMSSYTEVIATLRARLERAVELGEVEAWLLDGAYTREFLLHCEWMSETKSCWSARVDEAPDDCGDCGRSNVSEIWPDDGETAAEAVANLIAKIKGAKDD